MEIDTGWKVERLAAEMEFVELKWRSHGLVQWNHYKEIHIIVILHV